MKLFEDLDALTGQIPTSTVAIGTFDGIHVGHQAIIRTAVRDAADHARASVVFTFDRHPAELLAPGRAPEYITTASQRNQLIEEMGVDALVVAPFDHALAELTPDQFIERILVLALGARTIVVGHNFAFGKRRAGTVGYLVATQERYRYSVVALEPVVVDGSPASSTRVRELLSAGDIFEAERVLGHRYWLDGVVVEGQKLGRDLGFPTANLRLQCRQVVPPDGIYAVHVRLEDGRIQPGACSIGNRPTIPGAGRSIETYLLDFSGDLYGQSMRIRFVRHLRAEAKFASLEALKLQIERDVAEARKVLARAD